MVCIYYIVCASACTEYAPILYVVFPGPMDEWKVNALVALKGELKSKIKMTKLIDMLEIPAGGFLAKAEALSVRAKVGDADKMDEIIEILQGKGNKEFTIFCQMLQKCSYEVWAHELELTAEKFKTGKGISYHFVVFRSYCRHPLSVILFNLFQSVHTLVRGIKSRYLIGQCNHVTTKHGHALWPSVYASKPAVSEALCVS